MQTELFTQKNSILSLPVQQPILRDQLITLKTNNFLAVFLTQAESSTSPDFARRNGLKQLLHGALLQY
jgi:hypothetical protein